MERQTLTQPALWVMLSLAFGPKHAYAIQNHIATLTLMGYCPRHGTVASAIASLRRAGCIAAAWQEPGRASANLRVVYEITDDGWRTLRQEYQRIMFAVDIFKRISTRRALHDRLWSQK